MSYFSGDWGGGAQEAYKEAISRNPKSNLTFNIPDIFSLQQNFTENFFILQKKEKKKSRLLFLFYFTEDDFDVTFDTLVEGLQPCTQKAINSMTENNLNGHVINVNLRYDLNFFFSKWRNWEGKNFFSIFYSVAGLNDYEKKKIASENVARLVAKAMRRRGGRQNCR